MKADLGLGHTLTVSNIQNNSRLHAMVAFGPGVGMRKRAFLRIARSSSCHAPVLAAASAFCICGGSITRLG